MTHEFIVILSASLAALAAQAIALDDARADDPDEPVLGCRVTYELEAHPKGGAYDHVVHLDSACDFALACSIVSDEGHRSEVALSPEGEAAVTVDEDEAKTDFQAKIRCQPVADA